MAIHAGKTGLEPQMVRVGKGSFVFRGMTISAHECLVVGLIECCRIHDKQRIHPFFHISAGVLIKIEKVRLAVTFQTLIIFFDGNGGDFWLFLGG